MPDWQTILIFSDDAVDAFARVALEKRGFSITIAHDADNAYSQLLSSPFDLLIIDVARAQKGVEFVKRLRATATPSRILVLTIAGWGTGQATLALTAGADAFESKPVTPERLVNAVERLLRPKAVKTVAAVSAIGNLKGDQ